MCDCLVALPARTASRRTLFAKNSDRPPGEQQVLEWLAPRRDDGPVRVTHIEVAPHRAETIGAVVSRLAWMWGAEHGVNRAGVAIGNATIYTTLDPRPFPPALTGMDLVRLGLERGASAVEAVDVITSLLERYGQGGTGQHDADKPYWSSFLVADVDMAWVVETSGSTWEAQEVDGFAATSNRTTIESFDAEHRHPHQPVGTLVDPRLQASRALLAQPALLGPKDLVAHLRSHEGGPDGWTVCIHAGVQETTASVVAELGGRVTSARWSFGSPCLSVFVPLAVGPIGRPPSHRQMAALSHLAQEERDTLEAGLAADFSFDEGWPDEAWRRVTSHAERALST